MLLSMFSCSHVLENRFFHAGGRSAESEIPENRESREKDRESERERERQVREDKKREERRGRGRKGKRRINEKTHREKVIFLPSS